MARRRSGHVTLVDVANACGFSVSTVSIVLSAAPLSQNVAEETRQQIRTTARHLGYHPNAFAQSLRRRCSETIGVLAYDLSDPYCIPALRGIQEGVQAACYLPLLMDAQKQSGLFDRHLKMSVQLRVEGVIAIASWALDETDLLTDIQKNNVPFVNVSRDLTEFGVSSILVDNEESGALAMRHLHELGHCNIAVIRGPEEMLDSALRWTGAQTAAEAAGIRLEPRLVFQLPNLVGPTSGFDGGLECARRLLASALPFTAVLACDDLTALGVVRGLLEAGVRVPQDCTVVGFDDVLSAAWATPGITTVRQPLREMGLLAAEWVVDAIKTREQWRDQTPRLHRASPELVVRMSSSAMATGRKQTANGLVGVI